jgi:hypothetical protein
MRFTCVALSACVLTACGGGGGGDGAVKYVSTLATGQVVSAPTAFDSAYVAPNALYRATVYAPLLSQLPESGTYFYDIKMSMPMSPIGVPQPLTSASPVDLTTTPLGLPQPQSTISYLADGEFYKQGSSATDEISYLNGEVVDTLLSEDLLHKLSSIALVQVNLTPLSGTIVSAKNSAPGLLPVEIYAKTSLIDQGATWGNGAAYGKTIARYNTDTYYVNTANEFVVPNTTIASLIVNNKLFGTIVGTSTRVQGLPVFMASSPQAGGTVPTYATFYERAPNVYVGSMVKAGTVVTGISGYNVEARDSIKAALKF